MNTEIPSVGPELKAAREAQGLSLEQAAVRLRLMNRQVSAMEENNFAALGQPVFARGFVRNYARMLGLDAEAMVARLGEAGLEAPQKIENLPLEPLHTLWTSPWVLGGVAILIALIAIPVGLYLWLNSDETPPAGKQAKAVAAPARNASAAPFPKAVAPATQPPAAQPAVPAGQPPVPADAMTIKPIPPAATSPLPAAAPPQATDNLPEGGAPAILSSIKLDFDGDAWVEIDEHGGHPLMHRMGKAGSSVTLTGTPPFNLVIGNAAHVRMAYNGRPFDLSPYIDVKVARFNLEQ